MSALAWRPTGVGGSNSPCPPLILCAERIVADLRQSLYVAVATDQRGLPSTSPVDRSRALARPEASARDRGHCRHHLRRHCRGQRPGHGPLHCWRDRRGRRRFRRRHQRGRYSLARSRDRLRYLGGRQCGLRRGRSPGRGRPCRSRRCCRCRCCFRRCRHWRDRCMSCPDCLAARYGCGWGRHNRGLAVLRAPRRRSLLGLPFPRA
jgi:hypothetical protein